MEKRKGAFNFIIQPGIIVLGVLALMVLFCFPNPATAEKPDVINTAYILDLTGPYAPVTGPLYPGFTDSWNYVNDVLNGVHGVKCIPIIRDYAGKMDLGLNMYNEIINIKPKPLAFVPGSAPLGAALRERIKEDDLFSICSTAVETIYPVARTCGLYPLYAEQAALGIKYLRDNWKEKRNLKVGIITWDTGYGRAILTDEFYAYAKKIGVDVVGTELFSIKDQDATSQLLKLKAKNPDWLVTNCAAHGPLVIKKGCQTMGWKIHLLNTNGGEWGTVGLAPPLFENDISVLSVKSYDDENDPTIKEVMKHFNANKRTVKDRSIFYLIAWQVTLTIHEGLTKTVDKYGWEGLNGNNLFEVITNFKHFMPLGGITDVTYSPKRPTTRASRVYKITEGKFLPLTDFQDVPDLTPEKYR